MTPFPGGSTTNRRIARPALTLPAALIFALALGTITWPGRGWGQGETEWKEALQAWKYPGSMERSGSMGSGGTTARTTKAQSKFTTPDAFDDVAKFFVIKAGVDPDKGWNQARGEHGKSGSKSYSVQDDSAGRPLHLRIFTLHADETTTVVVISRADGEKETHIDWSYHKKTMPKP